MLILVTLSVICKKVILAVVGGTLATASCKILVVIYIVIGKLDSKSNEKIEGR